MNEDRITVAILRERGKYAQREIAGKVENMAEDLAKKGIKVFIRFRIKSDGSCKEKIFRCGYESPEELSDILGYRFICLYAEDIPIVCDYLDRVFAIEKTKDYINSPKPLNMGGYCGAIHKKTHIHCMYEDKQVSVPTEFQVTSLLMNAIWELDHPTLYKCEDENPNAYEENKEILAYVKAIEEIYTRRRKTQESASVKTWPSGESIPEESEESEETFGDPTAEETPQ